MHEFVRAVGRDTCLSVTHENCALDQFPQLRKAILRIAESFMTESTDVRLISVAKQSTSEDANNTPLTLYIVTAFKALCHQLVFSFACQGFAM